MTESGWRVLHVEDDATVAKLIERQVRQIEQIRAWTTVATLAEADALADDLFDIILLDFGLPDGKGLACIERIREAFPNTPLLVLTANIDLALGKQAVALGADDYLVKTEVRGSLVARTMGNILARRQLHARLIAMEQRVQLGERAAEFGHFMGQLINQMSHALATPLTPLALDVAQLQPMDERKQAAWSRAKRNVHRLQRAVASLGRVAQRVHDAQELSWAPLYEFLKPGRHIALESTVPGDALVPRWWGAAAREIVGRAEERGKVRVQLDALEGLHLIVEDDGEPLSVEELQELESPLGIETGLRIDPGLFLPRKLLESHDGFLRVEQQGRKVVARVATQPRTDEGDSQAAPVQQ